MVDRTKDYSTLVKRVREQLGLSQEDFAHELGVSFATVNRWENGQVKPSRLARAQIDVFYERMVEQKRLDLPNRGHKGVTHGRREAEDQAGRRG